VRAMGNVNSNKEGNVNGSKSNGNGNKEGKGKGNKRDGDGNKERANARAARGMGAATREVGDKEGMARAARATSMATKRAMPMATTWVMAMATRV
jgi:hypothetical protein